MEKIEKILNQALSMLISTILSALQNKNQCTSMMEIQSTLTNVVFQQRLFSIAYLYGGKS